jgi:putative ABC transport system permease protein
MNELTLPIRNLLGQPLRTGLTTLGIAVAVAGFIALTGLTQGVQHSFASGMQEPGADLVVTTRSSFNLFSSSLPESIGPDLAAVQGVEAVSGVLLNVVTADEASNIVVSGWPIGSSLWESVKLIEGRLPQEANELGVVLGKSIADGMHKRLGDTISLTDQPYTVVGIATFSSALNQNIALVPLPGLQSLLGREGTVTLFEVRLQRPLDPTRGAAVKAELARAAPKYEVVDTDEFASNIRFFKLIQAIGSTVSLVVLAMAVLAIANTLLMAVHERTFEIGILAAVGWRPARILRLILAEGIIMSVVGGVIGLGLGILTMDLVSHAKIAAGLMESYLNPGIVVQALVAAVLAGPLGALYPALRATRLIPAEALRRN